MNFFHKLYCFIAIAEDDLVYDLLQKAVMFFGFWCDIIKMQIVKSFEALVVYATRAYIFCYCPVRADKRYGLETVNLLYFLGVQSDI